MFALAQVVCNTANEKEIDFIPFRAEDAKDVEVLLITGNPTALRSLRALREFYQLVPFIHELIVNVAE